MTGELERRAVHASGSIIPGLYLLDVVTWSQVQALALWATAVVFTLEFVRLYTAVDWIGYRLLDRLVYRRLIRDYEETNPGGYALFVLGGTVVALGFSPQIAVPAFLMLTLADPASGVLATNEFAEPKQPFVLGVTFAICSLIAVFFVPLHAALVGAAIATIADGFTPVVRGYVIDDNVGIPVGAAVAMWATLLLPV